MILFQLRCAQDHAFESWFQSGAAFDSLNGAGQLSCPTCGDKRLEKALMAPPVLGKGRATATPDDTNKDREKATALAALREKIETTSDYVGLQFAAEARAMHLGDSPERPIYGEASGADARSLLEDGVPVLPLPFVPRKRAN